MNILDPLFQIMLEAPHSMPRATLVALSLMGGLILAWAIRAASRLVTGEWVPWGRAILAVFLGGVAQSLVLVVTQAMGTTEGLVLIPASALAWCAVLMLATRLNLLSSALSVGVLGVAAALITAVTVGISPEHPTEEIAAVEQAPAAPEVPETSP